MFQFQSSQPHHLTCWKPICSKKFAWMDQKAHGLLSFKYLGKEPREQQTNYIDARTREQPTLSKLVEKFWKTEDSISVDFSPASSSRKTDKSLKVMEDSIYLDGTKYNINLLWKQNVKLPNNFAIAKAHLGSFQKCLTKNRYLLGSYNKSLATTIDKGYVKLVVFINPQPTSVWYLPRHPFVNPNKAGKSRRVANAASMFQVICLKSSLEAGLACLDCCFVFGNSQSCKWH